MGNIWAEQQKQPKCWNFDCLSIWWAKHWICGWSSDCRIGKVCKNMRAHVCATNMANHVSVKLKVRSGSYFSLLISAPISALCSSWAIMTRHDERMSLFALFDLKVWRRRLVVKPLRASRICPQVASTTTWWLQCSPTGICMWHLSLLFPCANFPWFAQKHVGLHTS